MTEPRTGAGRALRVSLPVIPAKRIIAIEAEAARLALEEVAERVLALRSTATTLCHFAGRHIAGDWDVQREDVHAAIEEVRAVLAMLSTEGEAK